MALHSTGEKKAPSKDLSSSPFCALSRPVIVKAGFIYFCLWVGCRPAFYFVLFLSVPYNHRRGCFCYFGKHLSDMFVFCTQKCLPWIIFTVGLKCASSHFAGKSLQTMILWQYKWTLQFPNFHFTLFSSFFYFSLFQLSDLCVSFKMLKDKV